MTGLAPHHYVVLQFHWLFRQLSAILRIHIRILFQVDYTLRQSQSLQPLVPCDRNFLRARANYCHVTWRL